MDIKVGKDAIAEASQKLRNWGRWGKDDHSGTLNQVAPQDIVKAASLIRTGKVFALGIPLDRNGPQSGTRARFNPIHTQGMSSAAKAVCSGLTSTMSSVKEHSLGQNSHRCSAAK